MHFKDVPKTFCLKVPLSQYKKVLSLIIESLIKKICFPGGASG